MSLRYVDIKGLVYDPEGHYPERGVMRDGGNGVKHVFFGTVEATAEAVAKRRTRFVEVAKKYGYLPIRSLVKRSLLSIK